MEIVKKDQKILNKYLNGEPVTKALQTPLRNVRGYATKNRAIFIATKKASDKLSVLVALIATQKGWNSSMHTEGSYLVCLLKP